MTRMLYKKKDQLGESSTLFRDVSSLEEGRKVKLAEIMLFSFSIYVTFELSSINVS